MEKMHLFWYKNKMGGGGGGAIPPKYKVICFCTLINDTNEELNYSIFCELFHLCINSFFK